MRRFPVSHASEGTPVAVGSIEAGRFQETTGAGSWLAMTDTQVLLLLGLGLVLPVVAGLWARAWNRGNPLVWAAMTFFLTPFGFWIIALVLLVRGPRRDVG
jgi:hypothetical protein